jgi:O-antigen/teichoic acid export membrane protein
LHSMRDLSMPFLGETMVSQLSTQGLAFLLASVAGVSAVGAFRSAQVPFSPLNVLFLAVPMMGIPEGARVLKRRPDRFVAAILAGGAVVFVGTAVWCIGVLAMPSSIGERLLGDSWSAASEILPEISIYYFACASAAGALVGLRVLEAARSTFAARAIGGVVALVVGTIWATRTGAAGAAVGLGIGMVVEAVLVLGEFARRVGRARRPGGALAGTSDGVPPR